MAITINMIDKTAGEVKPAGAPVSNPATIANGDEKYTIEKQRFDIDTTGVADNNQVTAWANLLAAISAAVNTDLLTYIDATKTIAVDVYVLPFTTVRETLAGSDVLQPQTADVWNIPVNIVLEVN